MFYRKIKKAVFLERPNRFIAHILLDGKEEICHVKNTGRCRELLLPGAEIYVQCFDNPKRKTNYDLIAVYKGQRLINMDSQAPNPVFREWVEHGGVFQNVTLIRPECVHGDSRFDFYLEADGKKIFVEVKGVTLERDGVAMFPDAPTERGVKHLRGLCACVDEGFEAWAVFLVQMENILYFTPNAETHPEFAQTLQYAQAHGVHLLAATCKVTEDSITAATPVEIRAHGGK